MLVQATTKTKFTTQPGPSQNCGVFMAEYSLMFDHYTVLLHPHTCKQTKTTQRKTKDNQQGIKNLFCFSVYCHCDCFYFNVVITV